MQEENKFNGPAKPSPAFVDVPLNQDGNTYLHELCLKNAPVAMIREAVVTLGANLNAINKKHMPPLGLAILHSGPDVVEELISLGAALYIEAAPGFCFNAAVLACYTGNEKMLDVVLQNGGALHVNKGGLWPEGKQEDLDCLHTAVFKRHLHLISRLKDSGAFMDGESGPARLSALHMAARDGESDAFLRLIDAGASLEYRQSGSGMTALHYAADNSRSLSVSVLLDLGADPDAKSAIDLTPVMMAAANGNVAIIRELAARGADINRRQEIGSEETALFKAARKGDSAAVSALLELGADVSLTDKFNKSASDLARTHGHSVIAARLDELEKLAEQHKFEKDYRAYRP